MYRRGYCAPFPWNWQKKAEHKQRALEKQDLAREKHRCPHEIAAGPVPADVWEGSERIEGFDYDRDGCATVHLLKHKTTGSYYLQGRWEHGVAILRRMLGWSQAINTSNIT